MSTTTEHDPRVTSIHAFDGTRNYPWVTAGTEIDKTQSMAEALETAGLAGWNVRTETLTTESGIEVPRHYATVRDTDRGPGLIGVVGNRYHVVQNEDAFAPVEAILDTSDLQPETAGVLNGGQKAFISLHLPEGIMIGGQDRHEARLLALTSHDGSSAIKFSVTIGRLACFNALRPTLAGALSSWSIRHTSRADFLIEEARRALDLTFNYVDEFSIAMEKWLTYDIHDGDFEEIIEKLVPVNPKQSEGRVMRAQERQTQLRYLYQQSPTNEFGRGTKYAAYNALTEYADHYLPLRGADPTGRKRAERTMNDGVVTRFKARAQQLVGAL